MKKKKKKELTDNCERNEMKEPTWAEITGEAVMVVNNSNGVVVGLVVSQNALNGIQDYSGEIVGEVTEVGSKVDQFKVGDKVAVGCLVGSCKSCQNCVNNVENYCQLNIPTYDAKYVDGAITYGGFSDFMVADEHFVVSIPSDLPLDIAAPLLCAGITVYGPLRYLGLHKPDMHLGVVGLGGLGHLAVKFAKALGLKVTVISTSPNKKKEAIQNLGADSFVVSRDQDQMQAAMCTLDGIIGTVSAVHPLMPLIDMLKCHGKLVMVGTPEKPLELLLPSLIMAG
ncbi:hypothetical protein JHK82_054892 [Glycine max]|nr:hypothetical protein JHK86_054740 [Glycine max]KAG4917415.1 hypothetical protein JHK85_055696 [Glycine max]KAG5073537.1 hypothetical protein JHK84_054768 [Glycine max]KAG5076197.1 hypothetical protein JHK82_054892 [Glycine max]